MIPDGWVEDELGAHAAFLKGSGLSKSDLVEHGPELCIHYGELFTTYGPVVDEVVSRCEDVSGACRSRCGDVLMPGSDVTPRGLATASAVMVEGVILGGDVIAIRPTPSTLWGPYLAYSLRLSKEKILRLVKGSTVYHIHAKDLSGLKIPLPPLAEQQAIAEALSDADALVESLDALIAKKRDMKQAAMQQLLTGRTRLPGFKQIWERACLGDLGEISGAGVDKKIEAGELPVRLVNYLDVYRKSKLSSSDLTQWVSARHDQLRRCEVRKGDVFFTPTSEVPGDICNSAVAIQDIPDAVYSYHLVRLRLQDNWDLRFRAYAFGSKDFMDQATRAAEGSGTRYVVTLPRFRALSIRFPVDLLEQGAIGAVLSDMDSEIDALVAQREKAELVKQGMMQELLSGRVRLV